MEPMYQFWGNIWSKPRQHDDTAFWIANECRRVNSANEMPDMTVSEEDISAIVKKLGNWKAPGVDKIQAYWWKYFTTAHSKLAIQFSNALRNPTSIPEYFTKGVTYLLPKNAEIDKPKNYRPITCLPVVYKIFTGLLEKNISRHLNNESLLAREQNGYRSGARGSKEWLILDSIIANHAKQKKRNISVAWIDYRKAFDSVPHSWLLKVLKMYKINEQIITCLEHLMGQWETYLSVRATPPLQVRRGIFQGDSLSPLWFCLALNPLSSMLEASTYGYKISTRPLVKVSHLLYMDDLKLYAANQEQLRGLLEEVSAFSSAIHMSFGLEKCAHMSLKGGKVQEVENIILANYSQFSPLPENERYKYLGIEQTVNIDHGSMKQQIEKALLKRLKLILDSELYAKAKVTALNSWVLPVVTYSFGIIKWTATDLDRLDRLIRTTITKYRLHHPNSSVNRLYLQRNKGGRGLRNLRQAYSKEVSKLHTYLKSVDHHIHRAAVAIDRKLSPLNLSEEEPPEKENKNYYSEIEEQWKEKELHGRYANMLNGPDVDKELSTSYLKQGYLLMETEGFIGAIQDQVIATKNYKKYILKQDVPNDRCRLCNKESETIQHISSACAYLAPRDHKNRHDDVAGIIHQAICKKYGLIQEGIP